MFPELNGFAPAGIAASCLRRRESGVVGHGVDLRRVIFPDDCTAHFDRECLWHEGVTAGHVNSYHRVSARGPPRRRAEQWTRRWRQCYERCYEMLSFCLHL